MLEVKRDPGRQGFKPSQTVRVVSQDEKVCVVADVRTGKTYTVFADMLSLPVKKTT